MLGSLTKKIIFFMAAFIVMIPAFSYTQKIPLEVTRIQGKTEPKNAPINTPTNPPAHIRVVHAPRVKPSSKLPARGDNNNKYNKATFFPGSLHANILRVAKGYGWHQVVWNAPHDYLWVGKTTIRGQDLMTIFHQLLADYPLQAVFYLGNHVLVINPRTLRP